MTAGELTIAMFRATLAGFADPDQRALVEPYREKYFQVVGDIWRKWSSAMAQDFVRKAPHTVCPISRETVERTDACIRDADPAAAMRRLLIEGRDDVLRALRCRGPRPASASRGVSGIA